MCQITAPTDPYMKDRITDLLQSIGNGDIAKTRKLFIKAFIRLEINEFNHLVHEVLRLSTPGLRTTGLETIGLSTPGPGLGTSRIDQTNSTDENGCEKRIPFALKVEYKEERIRKIQVVSAPLFQNGRFIWPRYAIVKPTLIDLTTFDTSVERLPDQFERIAARYQSLLNRDADWNLEMDRILLYVACSVPEVACKRILLAAERRLEEYDWEHPRKHAGENHRIKVGFADLMGDGKEKELVMFQSCSYRPGFLGLFGWSEIEIVFGPLLPERFEPAFDFAPPAISASTADQQEDWDDGLPPPGTMYIPSPGALEHMIFLTTGGGN